MTPTPINENLQTPSKAQNKKTHKVLKSGIARIFDNLTEDDKQAFSKQIEQVEKDLEHKNTIKVKVRPGIIKLLCKAAHVHDIKG